MLLLFLLIALAECCAEHFPFAHAFIARQKLCRRERRRDSPGKGKKVHLGEVEVTQNNPKHVYTFVFTSYIIKRWSSYYRLVPTTPYILKLAMIDGTSPVCNRGVAPLIERKELVFFSQPSRGHFFGKPWVFDSFLVSTEDHSRWRK